MPSLGGQYPEGVTRMRKQSDSEAKLIARLIMLVFMIIFAIWFYAADASGAGTVNSKWTETSSWTDSDGDRHTSISYMVQFEDGSILKMFWGSRDWDRILENSYITYTAQIGRHTS